MKRLLILLFLLIASILGAQGLSREAYIDIPTAHYNNGVYINLNGNYPLKSRYEVGMDPNVGIELSLSKFNAILKWYNGNNFALDLSYQLLKEGGNFPSLSIGMNDLTSKKYISPVGYDDDTYLDERYTPRPPEVASTYLVATKTFTEYFEITVGMGRGGFIGYGPRSHFINLDVFSDERHEDIVFGLFGGLKLSMSRGPSLIIETNGRDANLGIQYESRLFKGTIGVTKLEHLFFAPEELPYSPRINTSFSFRAISFEKLKKGQVKIRLLAEETERPISGILTYEDGKKIMVNIPSTGRVTVAVDPCIYLFSLSSPTYKTKQAKIFIKSNQVRDIVVKLGKEIAKKVVVKKKPEPEEIKKGIESRRIYFSVNKSLISSIFYPFLDEIVELLKSNPNVRIEIGGHASAEGTYSHNQSLSEARANAVGEYLILRGIDTYRLSIKGYGMTRPVARNVTPEGRARNRRVEFIIISYE